MTNPPSAHRFFGTATDHLRVAVDFYDDIHKKKLTSTPYPATLQTLAGQTIQIPTPDFLAYYLFWKQRSRDDLYRRLADVKADHLEEALELASLITLATGTVQAEGNLVDSNSALTGRIGEGVALCVLNKVHDTGPGDWIALPEKTGQIPAGLKPFDYHIASSGKQIVQVEAKGSYIYGPSDTKTDMVMKHAREIAAKKKTHLTVSAAKSGIWKADVRYGTITGYGKQGDAQCWLLDPPTTGSSPAEELRGLARLLNATALMSLIAPRSHLVVALMNRAAAVLQAETWQPFHRIPLVRSSGEPFTDLFSSASKFGSPSSAFFTQRSKVASYPAGGHVLWLPKQNSWFFIGLREDLISHLVAQDFQALCRYASKPEALNTTVHAVVPSGSVKDAAPGPYTSFNLKGRLFCTSSGYVFGLVQ